MYTEKYNSTPHNTYKWELFTWNNSFDSIYFWLFNTAPRCFFFVPLLLFTEIFWPIVNPFTRDWLIVDFSSFSIFFFVFPFFYTLKSHAFVVVPWSRFCSNSIPICVCLYIAWLITMPSVVFLFDFLSLVSIIFSPVNCKHLVHLLRTFFHDMLFRLNVYDDGFFLCSNNSFYRADGFVVGAPHFYIWTAFTFVI